MKKALIPILLPLTLIFGLITLHNVLYEIYPMSRSSVSFGITMYYSWIIFGILLLIYNIYLAIEIKNKYIVGLILFSISIIFPLGAIEFRPFRGLLMITMFLSGFVFSMKIRRKGKEWNKKEVIKAKT